MFEYGGVRIRPIEQQDLQAILQLRSDPRVWQNLGTLAMINDAMQQRWFDTLLSSKDRAYYVLCSHEVDFLGYVRFDEIDYVNRSMRVGGDIRPEYQGKGFGTKMFALIKKYGFDYLNMNRLWLLVLDYNLVAVHLYSKAGFVAEGQLREAVYRDGQYHDYIVMAILRREYGSAPDTPV